MTRQYAPNRVRKIVLQALEMYRDQQLEDADEAEQMDHTVSTSEELIELADRAGEIRNKILDNEYGIIDLRKEKEHES